jgi:hypothetical protein
MTNTQFKNYIKKIVQEELRTHIKPVVNEILAEMLLEMAVTEKPVLNNSNKARTLREASYMNSVDEYDEYPTINSGLDRGKLAEMMGYGEFANGRAGNELITIDHAMTENGTPVPISSEAVPQHVLNAMNRDYRSFMKALETKRPGQ